MNKRKTKKIFFILNITTFFAPNIAFGNPCCALNHLYFNDPERAIHTLEYLI